jgi:hypothetical protein
LLLSYRLVLHPLRQFPGPFLGKLTSWRLYFQASSGDLHLQALKEHQKYGMVLSNTLVDKKHITANHMIDEQVPLYELRRTCYL